MTAGRRGLALPLALLVLVVVGVLVAATFSTALLEQRVGRNTLYLVQAQAAAEAGAAAVVGEWALYGLEGLLPGQSAVLPPVLLPGGAWYQSRVHRLNGELFEVRSTGTRSDADGGALAVREVGLLLRRSDSATAGPPVVPLTNRSWSW